MRSSVNRCKPWFHSLLKTCVTRCILCIPCHAIFNHVHKTVHIPSFQPRQCRRREATVVRNDAGRAYNTWPKMLDDWVPPESWFWFHQCWSFIYIYISLSYILYIYIFKDISTYICINIGNYYMYIFIFLLINLFMLFIVYLVICLFM